MHTFFVNINDTCKLIPLERDLRRTEEKSLQTIEKQNKITHRARTYSTVHLMVEVHDKPLKIINSKVPYNLRTNRHL